MADKYKEFLDFNWSDERWTAYLDGLFPTPKDKQLLKFKRKWYKRNVDSEFDDTYDPDPPATPAAPPRSSGPSTASSDNGPRSFTPPTAPTPPAGGGIPYCPAAKWETMGWKASACFAAYFACLALTVGCLIGLAEPSTALKAMVGAFVLEIISKHGGIKFNADYVKDVLSEDIGVMPFMAIAMLMPGLHRALGLIALTPPSLTAFLSFAQIVKSHSRIPGALRTMISPYAEVSARYRLMQYRADIELALGFALAGGVFMRLASPLSALLFWNSIMMRYQMSAWTQASFRKLDAVLSAVLGKIPGISHAYDALKKLLYSFVDPARERQPGCTVL